MLVGTTLGVSDSSSDNIRSRKARVAVEVPSNWRDLPLLRLRVAGEIVGLSAPSLYKLSHEGHLQLKRLCGRTLVDTASLIRLAESAENWQPSGREGRRRPSSHPGSFGEGS